MPLCLLHKFGTFESIFILQYATRIYVCLFVCLCAFEFMVKADGGYVALRIWKLLTQNVIFTNLLANMFGKLFFFCIDSQIYFNGFEKANKIHIFSDFQRPFEMAFDEKRIIFKLPVYNTMRKEKKEWKLTDSRNTYWCLVVMLAIPTECGVRIYRDKKRIIVSFWG